MRKQLLLCLMMMPFSVNAGTHCQVIHWRPNAVYTINGQLNHATHMIFPVAKLADPVVVNRTLWHVEAEANHLYFKPTNLDSTDGGSTTLSYIGENHQNFEFILKRVKHDAPECVIVKEDGALLNESWKNVSTLNPIEINLLKNNIIQSTLNTRKEKKILINQQRHALEHYRSQLFTKYTWKSLSHTVPKNLINSVYDDGRWTYIRLNQSVKKVMSLYGLINKHMVILPFSYDPLNKIYRVSGVYPTIRLIFDKKQLQISRLA